MATRYQLRAEGLDSVVSANETVILDDASEQYFATNPSGSLLFRALKDPCTHEELAGRLVDEFRVGQDQAMTDVSVFLNHLRDLDIVQELP